MMGGVDLVGGRPTEPGASPAMDRLDKLAAVTGGRLRDVGAAAVAFRRVNTDTRKLGPGDLFVALVGERFDAHDFLARAREQGAVAALVSRPVDDPLPQVIVPDTLLALQGYAAYWRSLFTGPVAGVTGSNGKTTTKQLLAAVLAPLGPVLATEGNLNNHIGVPLTLLALRPGHHAAAVIEMGANHAGEIDLLAGLARPDVGLVTQAADAHLEGFGSRDGVARAKGEIYARLGPTGTAVVNADDAYAGYWRDVVGRRRLLTFGLEATQADVRAERIRPLPDATLFELVAGAFRAEVRLPLPGRHNAANAAAAAAVGLALGVAPAVIARQLAAVVPPPGRLRPVPGRHGAALIDDSYNANPGSVLAAIQLLAAQPGTRWLALGDMAELGPDAETLHADAGRAARAAGLDGLFTAGPLSRAAADAFGAGAEAFADADALAARLAERVAESASRLPAPLTLLVKGSRAARMEAVVAALRDAAPPVSPPAPPAASPGPARFSL